VALARSSRAALVLHCVALTYGAALAAVVITTDHTRVLYTAWTLLAVGGLVLVGIGFLVPYVASMSRERWSGSHRAGAHDARVRWRDWLPLIPTGLLLIVVALYFAIG
jgi:hypothetical protein